AGHADDDSGVGHEAAYSTRSGAGDLLIGLFEEWSSGCLCRRRRPRVGGGCIMRGMSRLSHLNAAGEANMVDVSAKADSVRTAVAEGRLRMRPETLREILEQGAAK